MENKAPRCYFIRKEQLYEFVSTAEIGDILMSHDNATGQDYICYCTEDIVRGKREAAWFLIDYESIMRNKVASMTLEEKVDFLVEREIRRMYS